MDVPSGAWFSLKLTGGRYPALQPCLWSFRSIVSSVTKRGLILQRPGWSCSVLSCLILQMSPDILQDGQGWFDVTTNNRHRKSSFPTLCCRGGVFWSECLMVSKTSQSQGCEPRAEWSSLTHCQNIHSSTLMYPHTLTDPNFWQIQLWRSLWWIHSAKHCSHWNLFTATSTFSTVFYKSVTDTDKALYMELIKGLAKQKTNKKVFKAQ